MTVYRFMKDEGLAETRLGLHRRLPGEMAGGVAGRFDDTKGIQKKGYMTSPARTAPSSRRHSGPLQPSPCDKAPATTNGQGVGGHLVRRAADGKRSRVGE
ncbi:hypothetical protein GCM10023238_00260 [Streptomyces heliomycini]